MPARDRRPRLPRPKRSDPAEAQIARIDALTATGRTNWFALLAYLAFALVTTLGVEDVDFFVDSRQTELPLVGVSIPTFSFFVFAPILGAALYAYLHLHIRKVTEALAEAPAGPPPLEERIKPWLLNDFVLRQRHARTWRSWFREAVLRRPPERRLRAIRPRPLDRLAGITVLLLIWSMGPIVLTLMWWRTWPAHNLWLSLLCAACLMTSIYAGAISWTKMRQDLGRWRPRATAVATALVLFLVLPVTWLTTANSKGIGEWRVELPQAGDAPRSRLHRMEEWARRVADDPAATVSQRARLWAWTALTDLAELDPPDLAAARLSVLPPEETDLDTARHRYRTAFCARRGMDADVCDRTPAASYEPPPHLDGTRDAWCSTRGYTDDAETTCDGFFAALDGDFDDEWSTYRGALIAAVTKPDLSGRDLRRANLSGSHLVGVSFREADLREALLFGARLEGADLETAELGAADLRWARLEGAHLRAARMEETDLRNARLESANLRFAWLKGASLHLAQLRGALLGSAVLDGAVLWSADLEGASLFQARVRGADLSHATLRRADLREAQLDDTNFSSALMEGADLSFASLQGANLMTASLSGAFLRNSNLSDARLTGAIADHADLFGANLVDAVIGSASLDGVNLRRADLRGANLFGTRLRGANLRNVQLSGADLRRTDLEDADLSFSTLSGAASTCFLLETNLSGTRNEAGALRRVDLREAISSPSTDFQNSFGDATVMLPVGVPIEARPCQWSREKLSESEFHAHWRGWIELAPNGSFPEPWISIAPAAWRDVEPVPPPEGCTWHE